MCCHCPQWKMFWCESNDWWAWTARWLSALNGGGGGGSYSTIFLTLHWNVFLFGKAKSFTLIFTRQRQHLQGLSLRDHCACIIWRQPYAGKFKLNWGHSQSIKMSHLDKSASLSAFPECAVPWAVLSLISCCLSSKCSSPGVSHILVPRLLPRDCNTAAGNVVFSKQYTGSLGR